MLHLPQTARKSKNQVKLSENLKKKREKLYFVFFFFGRNVPIFYFFCLCVRLGNWLLKGVKTSSRSFNKRRWIFVYEEC